MYIFPKLHTVSKWSSVLPSLSTAPEGPQHALQGFGKLSGIVRIFQLLHSSPLPLRTLSLPVKHFNPGMQPSRGPVISTSWYTHTPWAIPSHIPPGVVCDANRTWLLRAVRAPGFCLEALLSWIITGGGWPRSERTQPMERLRRQELRPPSSPNQMTVGPVGSSAVTSWEILKQNYPATFWGNLL